MLLSFGRIAIALTPTNPAGAARVGFHGANASPHYSLGGSRGFTLIEILAVVTIIGMLLAVIAPSMRNYGGTPSLQTVTLPSLFDSARSLALSRSTKTRVLFQNDPADTERYRQWAGIMVQTTGVDAAGAPVWQQEGPPVIFRSGIYYFPVKSSGGTAVDPVPVDSVVAGRLSHCVAYEYDETGRTLQPGAPVMLVLGQVTGNKLIVKRPEARDGFFLRKFGGVTRVDLPDQLPAPVE